MLRSVMLSQTPYYFLLCILAFTCECSAQNLGVQDSQRAGVRSASTAEIGAASPRETSPLPTWQDSKAKTESSLLPTPVEDDASGYFPTQSDLSLLGDRDYARLGSANEIASDSILQNATGIFPYESGESNFYTRNANAFGGVNRTLGLFTPHQALTVESNSFPSMALSLDSSMGLGGLFTRTFDPSKAHVKLGPLAFDILWIGAGAVWSDYEGSNPFPRNGGDGWVGYIELAMRGYIRLTDSFYFSWATNLMYLPGTNELAFQTINGDWPSLGVEFNFQKRINGWDFYVSDTFSARPGIDIFANIELNGADQAGRYMFGYHGLRNGTNFYNSDSVFFLNEATAQATRMIGSSNWRFSGMYKHMDFWQTFDFDNYQMRDLWEFAAGYEGNAIPFAPRLVYQLNAMDGYDSLYHQVQLQFFGRITENVTLQSMIGYMWTSSVRPSRDDMVWSVNLDHRFSAKGGHGLHVGQQLITDSYSPDSILATNYRYYLRYQIARRLQLAAYAQYANGDRLTQVDTANLLKGDFDNYSAGVSMELHLLDFTRMVYSTAYERLDGDLAQERTDRWVHRLQIIQQLSSRLTMQLGYQYESFNARTGFNEHALNIGVRRYF